MYMQRVGVDSAAVHVFDSVQLFDEEDFTVPGCMFFRVHGISSHKVLQKIFTVHLAEGNAYMYRPSSWYYYAVGIHSTVHYRDMSTKKSFKNQTAKCSSRRYGLMVVSIIRHIWIDMSQPGDKKHDWGAKSFIWRHMAMEILTTVCRHAEQTLLQCRQFVRSFLQCTHICCVDLAF
jgi:hypothetical protein